MTPEILEPKLSLLSEEYVLIQAWKKTVSYIRSHNWYADTLELDRATVNLPEFLKNLAERLQSPANWNNEPLRIVPAPKSQRWHVDPKTGLWGPIKTTDVKKKIRPLAHVSLEDQVAATALMLCLANRVETLQGDPRCSIDKKKDRKKVVSYGNRLFCDNYNDELKHRWGSSKLYRGYFQDYRKFLARPEKVAEEFGENIIIVHSDLRQFYDRVSPRLLHEKIDALMQSTDEVLFYYLARRILCWKWDTKDEREVKKYATQSELDDFSEVALPQGLVASGFFSNIVLHDFDRALQLLIEEEFIPGVILLDACRYVDDIRLVIRIESKSSLKELDERIFDRLQLLLGDKAMGLIVSKEKTFVSHFRGDERPLVRQSCKMEKIQEAISGGFDAIAGEEILESIQGLVRSQARYSKERIEDKGWTFVPIADVRDETVARFAAARFRSTFRSLRPLLDSQLEAKQKDEFVEETDYPLRSERKTQAELDDEARAFALGLIENWVEDPSNVRLLRIGLDLWPAADVLKRVLEIIQPYTSTGGKRKAPRRVAWYCLAELFRAGATETGFVADGESLPQAINIEEYRSLLFDEAKRIIEQNQRSLPWYLKQQALLYAATNNPQATPIARRGTNPETRHYRDLIRYLRGETNGLNDRDYAIVAILARRSFTSSNQPVRLANEHISSNRYRHIAERDPSFAIELNSANPELGQNLPVRIRHDLCLSQSQSPEDKISLAELVLGCNEENRSLLSNELTLLQFSEKFLNKLQSSGGIETVAPSDVLVSIGKPAKYGTTIQNIEFQPKPSSSGFLYKTPSWCEEKDNWRFQLGFQLRFILTGRHDFTRVVRSAHWKEGTATYRIPENHWYQRIYGHHNGHSIFGADWLPITDWVEQFLYALLRWPGCRASSKFRSIDAGIPETLKLVNQRIDELQGKRGKLSDVLMLPLSSGWPEIPRQDRPLRVCVVQSVIPTDSDIAKAHKANNLLLSESSLRKKHRNHLSAALEAIKRMLDLRETHKKGDGRLDLLIFPELAIHPEDVETHLVPFSRAYKSIIFAGLTYEELFTGQPYINSALWLIPVFSEERGLQVIRRRQGKEHLAPGEKRMNYPNVKLQGFRPCQWLVGYKWDKSDKKEPLWLSGSICFDATDIRLAADLRSQSDVYAVSALNKDVSTFDQMALALQYHMFQMVIIANNGCFGGSNAYAPYREPYKRQVFHLHGQPQASMAFLEIDNIDEFLRRDKHSQEAPLDVTCKDDPAKTCKSVPGREWKCPPAGICNGDTCLHKF